MTAPSQGPDETEIREVDTPHPGPGEVTIDVSHAGVNFMDVMARRGDPGYATSWPYRPGLEVSGTVRATGVGVDGLVVGQRVAAFTAGGGLAEIVAARAALTVPIADEVPLAVAAAAPLVLTTALLLLTDAARLRQGETVLVHSAGGGVGSALAQLVPALGGGTLIGTVGRPDKVPDTLAVGYDRVFPRGDDLVEEVRSTVPGVDIVLDPQGTSLLDVDLDLVAPGGRIVLFGNASGGRSTPALPLRRLIGGTVSIGGFSISGLAAVAPHRVADGLRRVLDLVAEGTVALPVTAVALDEVAGVHQRLAEGTGTGKYVAVLGQE